MYKVITNVTAICCFSGLAIYFQKWWIALLSIIVIAAAEEIRGD